MEKRMDKEDGREGRGRERGIRRKKEMRDGYSEGVMENFVSR